MNRNADFDRRASAWLADGPTELADRVLDAALREVHLTHQRRGWSAPWRASSMSFPLRAAAAIAIVAIVGVGAFAYFNRAPTTGGQPTAIPTIQPTLPPLSEGALAPGRYAYDGDGLRVIVTVPAGWEGGSFGLSTGRELPDGANLLFLQPTMVFGDPCAPEGSSELIGPTVDDLVTALLDLPNVTPATQDGATISGFSGKHLEFMVDTTGIDCVMALYLQGSFIRAAENRQHEDLWILDVAGSRLVIDAARFPQTSAGDSGELENMVDTLVIEPD